LCSTSLTQGYALPFLTLQHRPLLQRRNRMFYWLTWTTPCPINLPDHRLFRVRYTPIATKFRVAAK
jgi:hypothetical protein